MGVYDPAGQRTGTIKRLLIDKASGQVLCAEVTFSSGLLAKGNGPYVIPWSKLTYAPQLDGYQTDVDEQVRVAPGDFKGDQIWPGRSGVGYAPGW
jgi:hypothetical protein